MLCFPFLVFSLVVSFSLLLLFCFNTFKIKIRYNKNSGLHGETLCNLSLDDSCAPSKPADLSTHTSSKTVQPYIKNISILCQLCVLEQNHQIISGKHLHCVILASRFLAP